MDSEDRTAGEGASNEKLLNRREHNGKTCTLEGFLRLLGKMDWKGWDRVGQGTEVKGLEKKKWI